MKKEYDYLIIGGGIAGVTAAETIRSRDQEARVAILSAEKHPLYSRVLLPLYLKKKIPRERVFLRSADDFTRAKIDFYPGTEVSAVNEAGRKARTQDGGIFGFGKLLIATGGRVKPWPPSEDGGRIYRLQTIDDADRLYEALPGIREPLIVGSSFIALEFLEIFLHHGIRPRVLARDAGFFGAFLDREGMEIIEERMRERGIGCFFGDEVGLVAAADGGASCVLARRAGAINTDAVAVGIGVERNREFLAGSGIAQGDRGVRTDAYLETSAPGVFAAGDIAEYPDPASGAYYTVGNWAHATAQGMRAGLNMTGERAVFDRIPAYAISALGMNFAAIGACDRGMRAVARRGRDAGSYQRFFIRDGTLAGAFLINGAALRREITTLIASRTPLGGYEQRLADPAFDIRAIPLVK